MILAHNTFATLLILILSACCWGLWAAVYRAVPKVRYELFYLDVAIGAGIAAVVAAMTVGSLGFDGFSVMDDVSKASNHQMLFAVMAGVLFNLANMLVMGAIAVAGLSVAVPIGFGISTMLGMGITVLMGKFGSPLFKFPGTACLLVGCIMAAVAYSLLISARQDKLIKEGKVKTGNLPGYSAGRIVSTDAPSATKALLLSFVGAALMWGMYPLLNRARAGDTGVGPYTATVLFMGGLFLSTLVFDLFFINLPVEGEPLEPLDYFRLRVKDHAFGIVAGALLCCGILGELVGEGGPPEAQVGTVMMYAIREGGVLLAAIWGVWVWKDFHDATPRVRFLATLFTLFLAAGVLLMMLASVKK